MIAEVTNTPWRERHAYVVERGRARGRSAGGSRKRLHVSPFMPMEQAYDWRIGEPGEALRVEIANLERGRRVFDATLDLRRRELSPALMTRVLLTYPPMSLGRPPADLRERAAPEAQGSALPPPTGERRRLAAR